MKVIIVSQARSGEFLVYINDHAVLLTKAEAELLSLELGYAIQDMDKTERSE